MRARLRRAAGGVRRDARDRRAGASCDLVYGDRAPATSGSTCRGSRRRTGRTLETLPPRAGVRGRRRRATATLTEDIRDRIDARARRHHADGVRRLLPDRVGPDPVRARAAGSASGPGRGSAAGSVVSYCLRITDLDPLRYGLIFERFLNPERDADARHRHGLRRASSRRGDPLRDRAVRRRTTSRRSSRSRRSRGSRASATPRACWGSPRSWATGSARCTRRR